MSRKKPGPLEVQRIRRQFEDILGELARLALLCRIDLSQESNVRAVLADDPSACGVSNPGAFRRMRGLLMLHYVTRERAFEALEPAEANAIVVDVVKHIRERLERHGHGR
jgi:hypothetical protein